MRKILFMMLAGASLNAGAQMKEGRIVYERTTQLALRIASMNREISSEMASQIPKSRTDNFELMFANNRALWQSLATLGNDDGGMVAGGNIMIRMPGANDISYTDFDKATRVDQREIADKNFIVSDSITRLNWKLSNESKSILGHNAMKATATRISTRSRMTMENGEMKRTEFADTSNVIAWFAMDIPVPVGPEYQGQLPGAILELDLDNGQTVYKALEISAKVNANKIKEPKDGKKVTAAEFTAERNKIMDEMRKNMQGGRMQFSRTQ